MALYYVNKNAHRTEIMRSTRQDAHGCRRLRTASISEIFLLAAQRLLKREVTIRR